MNAPIQYQSKEEILVRWEVAFMLMSVPLRFCNMFVDGSTCEDWIRCECITWPSRGLYMPSTGGGGAEIRVRKASSFRVWGLWTASWVALVAACPGKHQVLGFSFRVLGPCPSVRQYLQKVLTGGGFWIVFE